MLLAGDVENWAEQFRGDQWASEFARAAGTAAGVSGPRTRQEGYQFAADNPYTDDADSFAKVSADRIAVPGACSMLREAAARCRRQRRTEELEVAMSCRQRPSGHRTGHLMTAALLLAAARHGCDTFGRAVECR